jgi:hypothetical protein
MDDKRDQGGEARRSEGKISTNKAVEEGREGCGTTSDVESSHHPILPFSYTLLPLKKKKKCGPFAWSISNGTV